MGLTFDPTISLGTVITVGAVLVAALRISGQVAVIEFKVNQMWQHLYPKSDKD